MYRRPYFTGPVGHHLDSEISITSLLNLPVIAAGYSIASAPYRNNPSRDAKAHARGPSMEERTESVGRTDCQGIIVRGYLNQRSDGRCDSSRTGPDGETLGER